MAVESIELHDDAATEYDAAFDWYHERSPDAALRFDAEFQRALEHIAKGPQRWASGPFKTRRYLLRRFPFLVVYREQPRDTIQVIAVAHTSRRPYYWKHRL